MYENALIKNLKEGRRVYGFSVNFPEPAVIECVTAGWDYVWLDAQHGLMDYKDLLNCSIAARAAGVSTIIRVPGHDFSVLGPVADLCPQGLMVPMVNHKEEAEKVICCAKEVGKYSMFIAGDVAEARELEEMGADIIVCGSDYGFLKEKSSRLIKELKM